ncbi:hypothetical protein HK102_008719, partial [Quaeritorhiza haematococci]
VSLALVDTPQNIINTSADVNKYLITPCALHEVVNLCFGKAGILMQEDEDYLTSADLSPKSKNAALSKLHPVYLLSITCDRSICDIGFDPTKNTIQFQDWDTVLTDLSRECLNTLLPNRASKTTLPSNLLYGRNSPNRRSQTAPNDESVEDESLGDDQPGTDQPQPVPGFWAPAGYDDVLHIKGSGSFILDPAEFQTKKPNVVSEGSKGSNPHLKCGPAPPSARASDPSPSASSPLFSAFMSPSAHLQFEKYGSSAAGGATGGVGGGVGGEASGSKPGFRRINSITKRPRTGGGRLKTSVGGGSGSVGGGAAGFGDLRN